MYHPWLQTLIGQIYPGPVDESGVANLGIVAVAVALVSLAFVRIKDGRQRFAVLILVVGMVLALGPVLRWSGHAIQVPLLAPVNRLLWQMSGLLKPNIFPARLCRYSNSSRAVQEELWLSICLLPFLN